MYQKNIIGYHGNVTGLEKLRFSTKWKRRFKLESLKVIEQLDPKKKYRKFAYYLFLILIVLFSIRMFAHTISYHPLINEKLLTK